MAVHAADLRSGALVNHAQWCGILSPQRQLLADEGLGEYGAIRGVSRGCVGGVVPGGLRDEPAMLYPGGGGGFWAADVKFPF